jgi:hypothetical protein
MALTLKQEFYAAFSPPSASSSRRWALLCGVSRLSKRPTELASTINRLPAFA